MPTYLYCLRSDSVEPPDGCTGVDGATVRSLDTGGLVAWVSDVPHARPGATVERLRAHERVCTVALGLGETPLPLRFGQTFATDAETAEAIRTRATVLAPRLERVAGCAELRLVVASGSVPATTRGAPREPDAPVAAARAADAAGPGTSFLRTLARAAGAELAREAACEVVRRTVSARAGPLIVTVGRCESGHGVSYLPLLVRRADMEACREAVTRLLPVDGIEFAVLGPFPPYSFASDG